jgi:hypothetical protein
MWASIKLFIRQFFCAHEWEAVGVRRYAITPLDEQQAGEVALTFLRCKKCGAEFHRVADPTQGEK